MPDKNNSPKRFTLVAVNGEDKAAELDAFARYVGLEDAAAGRYSLLLVLQLFAKYASRNLDPAKVIREIRALEGDRGTK